MAIDKFAADESGWSLALAIPDPKHIWHTPGNTGRLVVFSGTDLPDTTQEVSSIVVSRFQLIHALAMAGKAGATTTAIAEMSVARQTLWAEASEFRRSYKIINALKLGLPGVNNAEMDAIFIAASAINPEQI